MKPFLLLAALAFSATGLAQDYTMGNSPVTSCSGNFYDSGGLSGNYGNNQNLTKTFYPATLGASLKIEFSAFELEEGSDLLLIYDGDNVSAPLIGGFTGTTLPPVILSSSENESGALTFRFLSDQGWHEFRLGRDAFLCGTVPVHQRFHCEHIGNH